MSITFRAIVKPDSCDVLPAKITPDQLAAFQGFALLRGIAVDESPEGEGVPRGLNFEAEIGRFALAQLAQIFDFDVAAITVLDEAQFRQRRVRLSVAQVTGEATMVVSSHADQSVEFCEIARLGLAGLRTSDLACTEPGRPS